jgi:hypothetical protein
MWKRILSPVDYVYALGLCVLQSSKKRPENGGRTSVHEDRRAARARFPWMAVALYAALFLFAAAPAVYLGWGEVRGFNSPDESAAFWAAQLFVEDGKLYMQDSLTELNPSVPTGPRGFTQHNSRSVPIYPLGHPLSVGLFHKLFGDMAPVALAVIPGLLILTLAILVKVLVPTAPPYIGFLFLGIVPLWYWSSRVYMNLSLSLLFIAIGILCLALAVQRRSLLWFFLGSSGFALGALVRHPEATFLLFVGMAFFIALIRSRPTFDWGYAIRAGVVFTIPQVVLFLLPMALLNWWTYGSPTSIGYLANYDQHLPERLPADSNMLSTLINYVRLGFFPVPVDLGVLLKGGFYQVLLLAPLTVALGIAGIFLGKQRLVETFGYTGLALLVVGLAYVLVSRADPGTFRALATEPDVRASIVRYWMPVYIVLGIGTAYAVTHFPKIASLALVCAMVFLGVVQVWVTSPEAVLSLKRIMDQHSAQYSSLLDEFTEPDALVFTGDRRDKWTTPLRRTAVTWSDTPTQIGIRNVVNAAESVYLSGQPVYFLLSSRQLEHLNLVNQELSATSVAVERLPTRSYGDIELLKVLPRYTAIDMVERTPGVYGTQFPASSLPLSIEINSSVLGHISNGSFERGLQGWSGPGAESEVEVTNGKFLAGQASLKMYLPPTSDLSVLVRQTYTVDATSLNGDRWAAIGHILVSDIVDAEASMRVFISDEHGNRLNRYEVAIRETSDAFQSLIIQGNSLPPNSSSIAFQLAIRPLQEGGSGLVYWDGVQIISGLSENSDDCVARVSHSCLQAKVASIAEGGINSGIESISLGYIDETVRTLDGPFYQGDRLKIGQNAIYLERNEVTLKTLDHSWGTKEDNRLDLIVHSGPAPLLSIRGGS